MRRRAYTLPVDETPRPAQKRHRRARYVIAAIACCLACAAKGPPPEEIVERATCDASPPPPCTEEPCSDVMFVLDISKSTQEVWTKENGREVSILEASARAMVELAERIQTRDQRVGLIVFSGGANDSNWINSVNTEDPAWVEVALTRDRACLIARISEVGGRKPFGNTHTARAIDQATVELLGLRGSVSAPVADRRRHVVVFTDGMPTLPYPMTFERDNIEAAGRALGRAARGGIHVLIAAVGREAAGLERVVDVVGENSGVISLAPSPAQLDATVDRFAELISN